jgi:hypothetical protein
MPGSNQFDAQGRQEPRGKRRPPRKIGGTGEDPMVGLNLTVISFTAPSILDTHCPSRKEPITRTPMQCKSR